MVERARAARQSLFAEGELLDYQAEARGYVYFYLDLEDTGERVLVRTDQIALELLWRRPGLAKQIIVGRRHREALPTDIHYYTDRLVAVLDNFGDRIVIAEGDNVSDVLHPVAPGADSVYRYRFGESVTLRLPGRVGPVEVAEVVVRPWDTSEPGFVGSVFLDRAAGGIVRMDFTFTPSSYRERELDFIRVSLENALWEEKYWLPYQQRLEVRRELPELDLPAGTVILARMNISDYRFNQGIPMGRFRGAPVTSLPKSERESFPFERDLHAGLREEGLAPPLDPDQVERRARRYAAGEGLSGLPATRLRLPAASQLVRYNRAEGVALGAGLSRELAPGVRGEVRGGWAFGPGHPLLGAGVAGAGPVWRWGLEAYLNRPRDLRPGPAASGVVNSVSTFVAGRDFLDLYYTDGVTVSAGRRVSASWSAGVSLTAERQGAARKSADFSLRGEELRPVLPTLVGVMWRGSLDFLRAAEEELERWWQADVSAGAGLFEEARSDTPRLFVSPVAELRGGRRFGWRNSELRLRASAGALLGDALPQEGFYLGGRGTLPGHPFRALVGNGFALGSASGSAELAWPWLSGRLAAAAGWVEGAGARGSAGTGVGVAYDILRLELHRGVGPGGGWEVVVEVNERFWGFL